MMKVARAMKLMLMAITLGTSVLTVHADEAEDGFWRSVVKSNVIEEYKIYLNQYPEGRYVKDARARIEQLKTKGRGHGNKQHAKSEKTDELGLMKMVHQKNDHSTDAFPSGRVFKDCSTCPEMVVVPSGSFEMGSNDGDSSERPVHIVRITKPFAVGKVEVTQGQWRVVMGSNPSKFSSCGSDCPVENVSWNDVQEFIRRINQKTGKRYRIPSEAEWEYTARAGTTTAYPWGNEASHEYANFGTDQCCDGFTAGRDQWQNTAPSGQFPPNAFGLHDMHGNVWEWTGDCWNNSYKGAPDNGNAWTTGDCGRHVMRGGSWSINPFNLRSANRQATDTGLRDGDLGFRLARSLY